MCSSAALWSRGLRQHFRPTVAPTESISIVIPTRNAGTEFRETLDAIRAQTRTSELVIIDSGSSDGTVEVAREYGARTFSIAPESFNHGETRNFGIRQSSGRFCIMLVQDALPIGETWLDHLVSPFSDERVVGVTGRHVPRRDSDALGRWQVEYRNRVFGDERRIQELGDWEHFSALDFQERLLVASFDNVCSAIRREFWDEHPFQRLPFAEDLEWGMQAIAAGKRLVYDPAICVVHSHTRPAAYHMRRSYVSGRIVPGLLRMAPSDPGVRNDDEFLAVLGFLCGEIQTVVSSRISDWREFFKTCVAEPRTWESFLFAAGLRPPPPSYKLNPIRDNFHVILNQLSALAQGPEWNAVLVQALADTAGSFAAMYYNWCESQGAISDGMRRLDRALAQGV